ncbi:hypothetical protein CYMTET_13502 [Cymbomonas tetramitiformis]|uniref:Uncharacterized protein n=1 Tax=Cymbomonas tetramitiformis TaxID=36881 RepID=A0AAE0LB02_9CHLO|nr:hypothetical protein CYMTET_13502 [Cymbomonas tetramitiformis]
MSGIVAWERLDKEVVHSSYQNRELLPFQHPDLQFMFTAPDHDMAIFISSPEFINHSTVTRQEYADLPLKTYASVQLANAVTMQEPHLWIQKVYKEMQDPTNKYWDTYSREPIYRVMLDRSNSFSEFGNFHVNEFLDFVGVDVGANARQAHNKVYKVGIPSEIKKGRTAWSNYALVQRDDVDNLCLLPTRKGEHFKTTYKLSANMAGLKASPKQNGSLMAVEIRRWIQNYQKSGVNHSTP